MAAYNHNLKVRGTIMSEQEVINVFDWIMTQTKHHPEALELVLLYSSSTHGLGYSYFQQQTNGKGPLLTVVRTSSNHVVGCYTDDLSGYRSNSAYNQSDVGAFIFRLRNQNGAYDPFKPLLVKRQNYSYCDGSHIRHGAGPDFHLYPNNFAQVFSNPNTWGTDPSGYSVLTGQNGSWVNVSLMETFQVRMVKSRVAFNLKEKGTIMRDENDLRQIFNWIMFSSQRNFGGGQLAFKLLYSNASHGFNAQTFHQNTDGKGPLLTVVQTQNNHVVGCYTDNTNGYRAIGNYNQSDEGAFIFRLRNQNGQVDYFKPPLITQSNYTYCDANGPRHGSGHDFYIHANMNQVYSNPSTWGKDPSGYGVLAGTNGSWVAIQSIEVFQVILDTTPAIAAPVVASAESAAEQLKPWFDYSPTIERKNELLSIIFDRLDRIKCPVNIVLFGDTGAGKSSIINALDSVFQGYVSNLALTGKGGETMTTTLYEYKMERINVWDTKGFDNKPDGYDHNVVELLLQGQLPSGIDLKEFNLSTLMSTEGFKLKPKPEEQMHAVVGVMSCSQVLDEDSLGRMVKLWNQVKKTSQKHGVMMCMMLTHIDLVDGTIEKDISMVAKSEKMRRACLKVFEKVGIPMNSIFPIWNYSHEYDVNVAKDVLILMALKRMVEMSLTFFRKNNLVG